MNTIKCDFHPRKKATNNVQLDYIVYSITNKGEYKETSYSSGVDPIENHHLCDSCFEKWENGELELN